MLVGYAGPVGLEDQTKILLKMKIMKTTKIRNMIIIRTIKLQDPLEGDKTTEVEVDLALEGPIEGVANPTDPEASRPVDPEVNQRVEPEANRPVEGEVNMHRPPTIRTRHLSSIRIDLDRIIRTLLISLRGLIRAHGYSTPNKIGTTCRSQ